MAAMQRSGTRICSWIAAVVLQLAVGCSDAGPRPVSVAAASSLRELVSETAPLFAKAHAGARLRPSFDASSTLARQIEAAAGYDVFLSADAETVERVGNHVLPDTRLVFLSNRLALIARPGLERALSEPAELTATKGRIAVAGPAVPAGKYAREWLAKQGLLSVLESRFVNAENVRAALALVETGAADHGFVYVTDARLCKSAKLLWAAPAEDEPGIAYVAAVTKGSTNPLAREYLRFLASEEFLAKAQALGFSAPK